LLDSFVDVFRKFVFLSRIKATAPDLFRVLTDFLVPRFLYGAEKDIWTEER
jgi:hypothetical protein